MTSREPVDLADSTPTISESKPAVIKAWTADEEIDLPAGASVDLDEIEAALPDGWIRVGDTFVNLAPILAFRLT